LHYTVFVLHKVIAVVALGVAPIVISAAGPVDGGMAERITVSAAISLTGALEEAAQAYGAAGGGEIVFNFAASNVLARQIVNGAPVDMFISADDAQMDVVERAGLIASGTRMPLLANQLAIVTTTSNASISSAQSLTAATVRRIAVGDPEAVPAGVYARQYLERIGLWQTLRSKLVPSNSVRAALAAVENGAADAAFVYATDARTTRDVRVVAVISGPDAPRIIYPVCILRSARHAAAAKRFAAYLRSSAGAAIFARQGFTPLSR
jgi:molybdate transport system substrate-binding protein